jgi:hypothetical protein
MSVGPTVRIVDTDRTYSMVPWIRKFNLCGEHEKEEQAARWLEALLDDLRQCRGMSEGMHLKNRLTAHMREVREMLWAVPAGHPLFEQPPYAADNPGGTWLRSYINMGVPLMTSTNASPLHAALRDMWLHPDLETRRQALATLAADTRRLKVLGPLWDSLIRDAAWEIVDESKHCGVAVGEATLLTLWTYRGSDTANIHTRHTLNNILTALLAKSESGYGAIGYETDVAWGKSVLAAHPMACVRLLEWTEKEPRFKYHSELFELGPDKTPIDGLVSWLPGSEDAIRMADALGLPYQTILNQVAETLTAPVGGVDLPENIAIEVAYG